MHVCSGTYIWTGDFSSLGSIVNLLLHLQPGGFGFSSVLDQTLKVYTEREIDIKLDLATFIVARVNFSDSIKCSINVVYFVFISCPALVFVQEL